MSRGRGSRCVRGSGDNVCEYIVQINPWPEYLSATFTPWAISIFIRLPPPLSPHTHKTQAGGRTTLNTYNRVGHFWGFQFFLIRQLSNGLLNFFRLSDSYVYAETSKIANFEKN